MSNFSLRGALSTLALAAAVTAGPIQIQEAAPSKSGYSIKWQDNFSGAAGQLPDQDKWWLGSKDHWNEEWQDYQARNKNVQLSGGNTLQLVPWKESGTNCKTNGEAPYPVRTHQCWSSGRVESNYYFTPASGKKTVIESRLRFGSNSAGNNKGIFPAFWTLGQACNTENPGHPTCGEVDIMERVNGENMGYGTLWCREGDCGQSDGTSLPNNDWHTWAVTWDRTASSWTDQSLTWTMDGREYLRVRGSDVKNQDSWNYIAAKPHRIIFNVAVGGVWPGDPSSSTQDGYGAMMEVAYVAHFQSN
ncbi:secreted glucosidase [Microdochium trichocladiopsis]|uniref:Secreted glucosidase n=1 Tax=Microdochium trichocladiopsis TaxID=1682393 RepID=A0A9P8YFZ0_9PEZI|nr:secreted glucosidase [Microdochium trichocladiopsis]KAH7037335.1 secreted glucosidase [Microdochium trichocladiopsis]